MPLGEWSAPIARAADAPPYHLVVLGDPHLPGKFLPIKERVLQTINAWADVDAVAVLGDICEDAGTAVEYTAAKQFFAALTKPAFFIAGNHDYIYEDAKNAQGRLVRGSRGSRSAKLARFRETFGVAEVYSSRRLDSYLLIFLSAISINTISSSRRARLLIKASSALSSSGSASSSSTEIVSFSFS